jgi:hypothetical protein
LQRNVKLYGPKHALDYENGSTCWNSDGTAAATANSGARPATTTTTSFVVDFGRQVQPCELLLQFQAGFAAEQIQILLHSGRVGAGENGDPDGTESLWNSIVELEAEDDHDLQVFPLQGDDKGATTPPLTCQLLKLVFDECTDFYGRITVYQLQVWGYEA